jgi:hypothetical protein
MQSVFYEGGWQVFGFIKRATSCRIEKMYLLLPLSSTHLWLCCSNFVNPSKKNYFGCVANTKYKKPKTYQASYVSWSSWNNNAHSAVWLWLHITWNALYNSWILSVTFWYIYFSWHIHAMIASLHWNFDSKHYFEYLL